MNFVLAHAQLLERAVGWNANSIGGINFNDEQASSWASPRCSVIKATNVQAKGTVIVFVIVNRAASNFNCGADFVEDLTLAVHFALNNNSALVATAGIKIIFNSFVSEEISFWRDWKRLVRQERIEFVDRVGRDIRHELVDKVQQRFSVFSSSFQQLKQLGHNDTMQLFSAVEDFAISDVKFAVREVGDLVLNTHQIRNVGIVRVDQGFA